MHGMQGLFNFKPSVRPVPLECHIQGYPGKYYCPRMATMNKPAYAAIQLHSPIKPVLVFVASRRQTRLTALDLIAFAAAADRPRQFVHMAEHELEQATAHVKVCTPVSLLFPRFARDVTAAWAASMWSCANILACPFSTLIHDASQAASPVTTK